MLTAEGVCGPEKYTVQIGHFQASTAPTRPISTAGKGKSKDNGSTFSLENMWKGKEGFIVTKIDNKKRWLEWQQKAAAEMARTMAPGTDHLDTWMMQHHNIGPGHL